MGGAGHQTTTSQQQWPKWLEPYAMNLASQYSNTALPGGQIAPYNTAMNYQVAGLTPGQQASIAATYGLTGDTLRLPGQAAQIGQQVGQVGEQVQPFIEQGQQFTSDTLAGKYLDPSTNPYLQKTFNQAATDVGNQYQMITSPELAAQAQHAGAYGGSGYNAAADQARYGLGQTLDNLATNIYGGNYQTAQEQRMQALGELPQQAALSYLPAQQQLQTIGQQFGAEQQAMQAAAQALGVGGQEQAQQQNVYNAGQQNAMQQFQYPYTVLGNLGQGLQYALGPAGNASTTVPIKSGMWGGLK